MYDYLIAGSGLFGAVFAYEANKRGKKCLVIERRSKPGGNLYCKNIEGINVHYYGAHIFHTSNKTIWDYVNHFVPFNHFINAPIANYNGEIFNLPFNMNTFNKLWGVITPEQARQKIKEETKEMHLVNPENLEEQAIKLVGHTIYTKLIKGYTEKQWGRSTKELPAFIINRIPLRYSYDNNYFNDTYQGIPMGGYNILIAKLLKGIDLNCNVDYFENRNELDAQANKVVFTGMIDAYYEYCFGPLEYRTLNFKHETLEMNDFQGNAVVNYTDSETAYTRIIEHKHFEFGKQEKTVISREYPGEWKKGDEPYYPVNDQQNLDIYMKYKKIADKEKRIIFGGRLAEYKYYDMDQVIESALKTVKKEFNT